MISQRTSHYLLWFLLLGMVAGIASLIGKASLGGIPQSEPIWLCIIGGLGIIAGMRRFAEYIARPFDVVVGLVFILSGLLGVLHNFGFNFISSPAITNVGDRTAILGLSLSLPFALLHMLIGLTSLNQGLKPTLVVVNSATPETR